MGVWKSEDDDIHRVSYDNQSFEEEDFESDMIQKIGKDKEKKIRINSETFSYYKSHSEVQGI